MLRLRFCIPDVLVPICLADIGSAAGWSRYFQATPNGDINYGP
jgi:hypothetical protein